MVSLSSRTRYGIRALIYMAESPQKLITLGCISQELNISFKYLENIFKLLKRSKIVSGIRGPEGGYRLMCIPSELTIYEIIDALDGPLFMIDCGVNTGSCENTIACSAWSFWGELQDHVKSFLQKKTLAHLLDSKSLRGRKNE